MSLLIEAGKLAEHLRWHGDEALRARIAEDPEQVSDELADVLYWMLLLAHDLGIDLDAAIAGRTLKVERKYPLASARGSAWKYEERLHGMDLRGGVVAVPAEVGVLPADAPVVARVHVGGFGDGQLERLAGCAVPGGAAFEAHQALAVDAVLDVDLRADLFGRPTPLHERAHGTLDLDEFVGLEGHRSKRSGWCAGGGRGACVHPGGRRQQWSGVHLGVSKGVPCSALRTCADS